jgi:hypothetical protein
VELQAAVVGAGISLAGVVLTLWWTDRREDARLDREHLERLRSEKRRAYAAYLALLDEAQQTCRKVHQDPSTFEVATDFYSRLRQTSSEVALVAPLDMGVLLNAAGAALLRLFDAPSADFDAAMETFVQARMMLTISARKDLGLGDE